MYFLSVNYHYIHEENTHPFPSIYPTTPERLEKQLERIGNYFEFISQDDLILALLEGKELPERCCLITFDDGLKSQYEHAVPILRRKGIPAVFFVNALPYKEKKACMVHKIHWVRAHLSPEEILKRVNANLRRFSKKSLDDYPIDNKELKNSYRYDSPKNARVKILLNFRLPEEEREKIVDSIFQEVVEDESEFCREFYMSPEAIVDLHASFSLGIHSYSHIPLSRLSKQQFVKEIKSNVSVLEKIVQGKIIKGISYPYGKPETVDANVARQCKDLGFVYGLTMERAFNRTLHNPLLFARMDTNDALGGKYPAFDIKGEKIKVTGKVTMERGINW